MLYWSIRACVQNYIRARANGKYFGLTADRTTHHKPGDRGREGSAAVFHRKACCGKRACHRSRTTPPLNTSTEQLFSPWHRPGIRNAPIVHGKFPASRTACTNIGAVKSLPSYNQHQSRPVYFAPVIINRAVFATVSSRAGTC